MKRKVTIHDVNDVYKKSMYMEHTLYTDIPAVLYVTRRQTEIPIWITLLGSSSSGKTTMVKPFLQTTENDIFQISQITSASFASGVGRKPKKKKGDKETDEPQKTTFDKNDVGYQMQNKHSLVIVNDMSSIFSMDKREMMKLQGLFRELYDGFIKVVSASVDKMYSNIHCNMLMMATPQIYDALENGLMMGSRELAIRVPKIKHMDKLGTHLKWDVYNKNVFGDTTDYEKERMMIIRDFINEYKTCDLVNVPESMADEIWLHAMKISTNRATVKKDYQNDVMSVVDVESPARLYKQLLTLASGFLTIGYNEKETQERLSLIVNSSGNMIRQPILNVLKESRSFKLIIDKKEREKKQKEASKKMLDSLIKSGTDKQKAIETINFMKKNAYTGTKKEDIEDGLTTKQIASILGVSIKGVRAELLVLYQLKQIKSLDDLTDIFDEEAVWVINSEYEKVFSDYDKKYNTPLSLKDLERAYMSSIDEERKQIMRGF